MAVTRAGKIVEGEEGAFLVVDCGGTNVRFAVARTGGESRVALGEITTFGNDAFDSFDDALAAYLEREPTKLTAASIAFAGPISRNAGALTNRPSWRIDGAALARRFGLEDVLVINDFAAAARGAVVVADSAFDVIKPGQAEVGAPTVVAGPGTGFGMATVLSWNDRWRVIPGEGGHQTYAPETPVEWALAEALRRTFGHVSVEIVVAGKHAEAVREALCTVLDEPFEPLSPDEVLARAAAGDRGCRAYCELRAAATMSAVSDAALFVGAKGGVVLTGGVAAHLADYLRAKPALERFESHGPMSGFVRDIPVRLVSRGARLALTGAAHLYLD